MFQLRLTRIFVQLAFGRRDGKWGISGVGGGGEYELMRCFFALLLPPHHPLSLKSLKKSVQKNV